MPGPTFTELPILGTLASSHPFHSQLLCSLPSPSLPYITTMPSKDHLVSQILVFPYHPSTSDTFVFCSFQPLYPPSPLHCSIPAFSSCAFEISEEIFLTLPPSSLLHGLIHPFPLLRDFTPVYPSHFWQ